MGASLTGFNVGLYAQEICFGAYSGLLLALIISKKYIVWVVCLSGAIIFAWLQAIVELVAPDFLLAEIAVFCHAIACAVRNCLLIYLLCVSIFSIACLILLLPYFFAVLLCTDYLILGPNSSLLRVLLYARLPRYHFLVLRNYYLPYFASCWVLRVLYTPSCQKKLVLWWSSRFGDFVHVIIVCLFWL